MTAHADAVWLRATPDYVLGHWGPLFICSWRFKTEMDGADDLAVTCSAFAKEYPDGIGLLTIIEDKAPAPDNDARSRIADFLGQAEFIAASGVAFEGSGFRAAAVRSIVSGLTILARQPFPHKVFSSISSTMDWLTPELNQRLGETFTPGQANSAIRKFRLAVDAEVPKAQA